jgi:hypothetical protein
LFSRKVYGKFHFNKRELSVAYCKRVVQLKAQSFGFKKCGYLNSNEKLKWKKKMATRIELVERERMSI